MGGLWVDYELMTNVSGLYALGECNFADHGANRLGANSLLQACVDGYFIIPTTIGNYLATQRDKTRFSTDRPEFDEAAANCEASIDKLLNVNGDRPVDEFHRALGSILWNHCGISRSPSGLTEAIKQISELRDDFHRNVRVTGGSHEPNSELEKALRISDYLELAELMCRDALNRDESCEMPLPHRSSDRRW